ncbi:MMPL family transporter [Nannocystaceae bacterium ST9]
MHGPRRWLPVLLAALWLAAMGVIVATKLSVTSEITHFLAAGDDARLARLSRQLAESELTKTTILVVGSGRGDRTRALAAAGALADTLEQHEEVAWVRRGWDPRQNQVIHELYFPRRFDFASEDPAALAERLSPAGLDQAARDLVAQLRLPTATMLKQTAPRDPLLLYPAHLRRLEAARAGPLEIVDDRFVTSDGRAVIFLASVHSPFESAHQGPLQTAIAERFAELAAQAEAEGDSLVLQQSGVGRFALRAESRIRGDITRISTISTVGVILLFLVLFRSPRLLLLSMVPLAAGVLTASGVGLLVFGQLHGLTLAFGASLIGVCIDYPIHLFTHHALHSAEHDRAAIVARVRPGLLLGALTTVAGFVGLGWTAFPGVREIAVFAALGILAALLTTLFVLPPLLPAVAKPVRSQQWLLARADRLVASMTRKRGPLVILPLVALVIVAIGLPQLRYQDDVSALTEPEPDLLAEDDAVRSLVSRMDGGRMIVAIGDDDEQALARNDAVHRRLSEAQAAGELAEFRSLHTFLWSPALQAANRAQFCERPTLAADLDRAFVDEGLRAGAFAAFADDLAALCDRGEPAPLDWSTLAGSPLGPALASMRTEIGDQVAILTLLRGVEDPELLRARLADLDEVVVFDQRALMAEIYGQHRTQTIELVGIGLVVVLLIIFARHRRWRPTLAAFTPALLAAATALALLILFGQAITLLHVVALLLVLSMGVDYGVFLTESREQPREVAATVVSLLACCLSTVLAFGLLGMSSNPALQAIGLTTGLGVLLSLILAPTALVLLGAAPTNATLDGHS